MHGLWKRQVPEPLTNGRAWTSTGTAAHQADCLLRAPDLGPTEAEPQRRPMHQIPLDTQREPRGPVQWADEQRQCRVSGHLPGHLSTLAGSAPKGLVPGQMWRSREAGGVAARCPHWSPKHAHSARRGGWAPGQLGQGGPRPPPDPTRCERWTPAEELAGGGGGGQYIQRPSQGQTPPLYSPHPPELGSQGGISLARAQSLSKQPRERQSRAVQTRWLPAAKPWPFIPESFEPNAAIWQLCIFESRYGHHSTAAQPRPSQRSLPGGNLPLGADGAWSLSVDAAPPPQPACHRLCRGPGRGGGRVTHCLMRKTLRACVMHFRPGARERPPEVGTSRTG